MTRWLTLFLALVAGVAGWLGWEAYQWRQAYYAEMTNQLVYQVGMAHRQLVRAQAARAYQEKIDAMAAASGYLVTAHTQTHLLFGRLAPARIGRPAYMPGHHVPMLLQYARELTPDMPDQALQRRVELVAGLEQALKAGLSSRVVKPGYTYAVDIPKLKQSLDDFFLPMYQREASSPLVLRFEDAPNRATVTARMEGNELRLRFAWEHTYRLFSHSVPSPMLLVRAGAGVQAASDAGPQQRMGLGAFEPVLPADMTGSLHDAIKASLPEDWTAGSYTAFRVPEGLPQTLTLRLPEGARPSLLLLRPASGENADPIEIGP